MSSLKQLQGVAHNIAHHSQSSLSWLHPHLGQACDHAGVTAADLELLAAQPYPSGLPTHELLPRLKPLEMVLQALQAKFWDSKVLLARMFRLCVLNFTFGHRPLNLIYVR